MDHAGTTGPTVPERCVTVRSRRSVGRARRSRHLLGTGISAGASTFLESTLSYVSDEPRFQRYRPSRDWRVVFTLGIVSGAAVYAAAFQGGIWLTEVEPWRLLAGGFLIGVGTRVGKGCTSGHGVCGVGSASRASFVNVAVFLSIAVGVALLMSSLGMGVAP